MADKISNIDKMGGLPPVLIKQRSKIREMMRMRCAMPGCPIPMQLANRAADWILMLVSFRANERRKLGKEAFPDQQTLTEDIARSAEAVEIVFTAQLEEINDQPAIFVASAAMLNAANDDHARSR